MSRSRDTADQINRVNSSAANATAITISALENVGIGTSSPDNVGSTTALTINRASGNGQLSLMGNGTVYGRIFADNATGDLKMGNPTSNDVMFYTANLERMRIDATGAVTMPTQPAFLAQVATVQSNLANYVTVAIFGTEVFDQNADFNNSTGVFTAPVTGKYMLSTMLRLDQIPPTGTGVLQAQFATSNRTVFAMFDPIVFDATSTAQSFSQSLLMDMDAGDTAKVQVYMPVASSTVDIATTSWFSGYLVA